MPAVLPDIPAVEAAIVEMTNAYRGRQQLSGLKPNDALAEAARAYAVFLARTGEFSHTADGRGVGDRIAATGYAWCQVGENLAMHVDSRGFQSDALAEKAVEGWINSPGHHANIVAPHMTEIGVGVASAPGRDPKFVSVQLFARPKSLQYAFQISNTTGQSVSYSFGGEAHEVRPSSAVTHTTCSPGDINFDKVSSRYEARDGLVYTLSAGDDQTMRVEVKPLQRIR